MERPRRRWEDNIEMDLREVRYDDRDWIRIHLAHDRERWWAYVLQLLKSSNVKKNNHESVMVATEIIAVEKYGYNYSDFLLLQDMLLTEVVYVTVASIVFMNVLCDKIFKLYTGETSKAGLTQFGTQQCGELRVEREVRDHGLRVILFTVVCVLFYSEMQHGRLDARFASPLQKSEGNIKSAVNPVS
ncbi:hypothetical protein ANN_16330 [Periplaneta americana]|uniref:Uncharacterized protein n=1 Tax=Periplaneta americana TaxID=6978 RepID=A0ABQ8SJN0_PERAM|nr:hypothetical protein ANN_16330 [Periplaneta americana]